MVYRKFLLVCVLSLTGLFSFSQSDGCAPATTYNGVCNTVSGTNAGATTGPEDSYAAADICAGSVENTVWYEFTAPANDTYTLDMTCATSTNGWGLQVGVLTGPCGGPYTSLNCMYVGSGTSGNMPFTLTAGQSVWIVIDGDAGDQANFDMSINPSGGCTCFITNFGVTVGACVPATNTFSISGSVEFTTPPTTGQLIVEDCNGNQQVFNAPFTSPQAYNIGGIAADGAPCDVTAYFTADPACTATIPYNNPAPCPPSCFMNYLDVTVGACDPSDNNFDLTGEVQFTTPPTTGQLIIEDCNGNQTVYSAPFASPIFYTIADIPSDGTLNCSVTAYFTDDPACTLSTGLYDNPAGCICTADAGTYSEGTVGSTNSTGPYNLCFGDQLDITANGDYTPPQDFTVGWTPPPAPLYDPGIWLFVYSCPPSVFPPNDLIGPPPNPPYDDPCLLGVASTANGAWSIVNNLGDGSSAWFVPVTMYSMTDGIYAVSINGGNWCYDMGPAFEVTFLEDIITNLTEDCQAGTATVTVSGGQPASDGSNFTATNLLPATASFGNTTAANGGTITITGLQDGDNYSFDIGDGTNCSVTITGTFTGIEDPAFTYPQAAYCQDDPNPSPTITGVPGGTFTAPAGVSINAATGVINLAASTAGGPYTITYTTPDPICFDQATFDITINPLPTVDGNDVTICAGDMVTLSGTGADTYVWTGGVIDGVAFAGPATTTTYTVTGTITATGCSNTGDATVTVNPQDDASFTTTDFCVGNPSPAATITGTPGGTFAYNPNPGDGSTVNAANGSITGGVGGTTYTIEYTTSGPCPATSTQTVTVNALPPVDVPDYSVCTGGTITLTATGATTYSWSPGTDLSGTVGASVDFTAGATNTYTVTGTDGNGCVNTDVTTVTVIPNAPIDAGADVTICEGDATTLTATGGVTYNWQAPISAAGAIQTVSPVTTTIYTVDGVDAAGCTGTDQVTVTVNPLPTATITGTTDVCEGDPAPTITFTGANGTAPYTFTYNINGGANQTIVSVGNTATVTVPTGTSGTFDYNLVDVTDASSTTCSQAQAGTATVVVNPIPTATIAGTIDVCEGDPAPTITFTGANGTAPYTFTYNINGGANQTVVSIGNTATITVPTGTAGTYDYNLVDVTDASSTACSQTQTGTATVVVNPMPTATIAGTIDVCIGGAAVITFTGANGTAPYTFTYNINGGPNQTITSVGNTATINAPTGTPGVYDYNLVSVQDASSTACSQAQVGTATVTVNPSPTAAITGSVDVCLGDPDPTVTFTGANGTAPYTFTYTINGGANLTVVSVGNIATVTAPTGTAGTFVYDLVSVEDASSTSCSQGAVQNVTIVVNPLPTATIAGSATLCEGDPSATITFTGANGTAPYTFTYDINGGASQTIVSVGNTATIAVPSTPAGTFDYNLLSVQDASSTTCSQAQVGTATIVINPLPTATIAGTIEVCQGDADPTITFTGANGTAPYTFTYNINGGASQTVTSVGNTATVTAPTTTVGQFDYNLVSVEDASSTTCSQAQTGTATVTVNPLPTATIAGTIDVCVGDAAPTITLTGANGTAPYTFTYNINGGANQTVTSTVNTATIMVPTGTAGTFDYNLVDVTDASATACSQTQVGTATVVVNPLPTATIAGSVTVCEGDVAPTITFTGAAGTAPYTFTYNINGGANLTVVSVGNTATVTAPTGTVGTFDYNLVSVEDASSTSCSQAQVGTATVIVNPLPTAVIAGTVELCEGDADPTITFTGANGTAPYTFTYNINGGANQTVTSVGNTATVTASTATPGVYDYNLVSVQDASATGCSQAQVQTVTVTINSLPTATIAGTITVCEGDTDPTITFTGANGTAPYTFTYNINGGPNQTVVSIGNTATVTAPTNVPGVYDYNLVSVVDASNTLCSQAQTGTATVTVNPSPTATIDGDAVICFGDPAPIVTFTGGSGTAPYTFTYTLNGGANQTVVSTGNTATVTSPAAVGTYVYDLVSVADASITGCSQSQTGTVTIVVNDLPVVFAGNDVVVCDGDQITLSGSGAQSYSWDNGIIDGVPFTPTATTIYTVTGTDANGCVNTDDVTVTFEPLPDVSFIADVTAGCEPLTVTFTNTTGGNLVDCVWEFSNGTVLTGCGSVTTTFPEAGLYDVTLTTTSANGCTNSTTYFDYIYVEADPIASFYPSSSDLSSLSTEVHFDNVSTGAVDYLWNFGDESATSTEFEPTHVFPNDGDASFVVELVAYSPLGCTDTAWFTITVNEELLFYVPNTFTPDNDNYNQYFKPVFTSGFDPFDFELIIFDRWGEIIWESHDASVGWDGTYGGGYVVQDGTYTWRIEFKTTRNDERVLLTGHVNVIR